MESKWKNRNKEWYIVWDYVVAFLYPLQLPLHNHWGRFGGKTILSELCPPPCEQRETCSQPARRHLWWKLVLGRSQTNLGTVMPELIFLQEAMTRSCNRSDVTSLGETNYIVAKKKQHLPWRGAGFTGDLGRQSTAHLAGGQTEPEVGSLLSCAPPRQCWPSPHGLSNSSLLHQSPDQSGVSQNPSLRKGPHWRKTNLLRGREHLLKYTWPFSEETPPTTPSITASVKHGQGHMKAYSLSSPILRLIWKINQGFPNQTNMR